MQVICVNDTHVFLFSCTHKVGHNNIASRLFFPLLFKKKKCHGWEKKYLMSTCALAGGEEMWGKARGMLRVGSGSGIMLHEISSAASSMKPNPLLG